MLLSHRTTDTIFRCGPQSPCKCSVSKNDNDTLIVEFCPKKNSRMLISGIVAKKIYFQKAAIIKNYNEIEYVIANNTFHEIVDFSDDFRIQTELFFLRAVFINNSNLILTDRRDENGFRINTINFKDVIFCNYAVKQVTDYAFWTDNLTFYDLDQFSMNFSVSERNSPFVNLGTINFLINGKMSDIFLPIFGNYDFIIFQNVESTSEAEMLKDNFLFRAVVGTLVFRNSIHVTLPVSFPTGFDDNFWDSSYRLKLTLDVWNMQKGTFSKNKMIYLKEINGILIDSEKSNALSTATKVELCSVFCDCGTTNPSSCSKCTNDFDKKTCAICVKNKAETSEVTVFYKNVCHLQNFLVVNGPQFLSNGSGSAVLMQPKTTKISATTEFCGSALETNENSTISMNNPFLVANYLLYGACICNLVFQETYTYLQKRC